MADTMPFDTTSMLNLSSAGGNPLAGIAQLITGIANLGTANSDLGYGRQAAGMADPWSSNRGNYQNLLNAFMGSNAVNPATATAGTQNAISMLGNLLSNPASLVNMPGYQFGLNQALESVNRGAGASGMLNSGNRLAALQDRGNQYAQGWQNQIYNQLLGNVNANVAADQLGLGAQQQGYNELANLAGVNAGSPTAAAQALLNGVQGRNQALGSGLGGIALGGSSLMNTVLPALQRMLGGGAGGIDLSSFANMPVQTLLPNMQLPFGVDQLGLPEMAQLPVGNDFGNLMDLFGGSSSNAFDVGGMFDSIFGGGGGSGLEGFITNLWGP
jgi:hypothetical protein